MFFRYLVLFKSQGVTFPFLFSTLSPSSSLSSYFFLHLSFRLVFFSYLLQFLLSFFFPSFFSSFPPFFASFLFSFFPFLILRYFVSFNFLLAPFLYFLNSDFSMEVIVRRRFLKFVAKIMYVDVQGGQGAGGVPVPLAPPVIRPWLYTDKHT